MSSATVRRSAASSVGSCVIPELVDDADEGT